MSALRRAAATAAFVSLSVAAGAPPASAQDGTVLGAVVDFREDAKFSWGDEPLESLRVSQSLVHGMKIVTYLEGEALMTYDDPQAMLFLGHETTVVMRPRAAILADYPCPNPDLVERAADLSQERGELRLVRKRAPEACPLQLLTRVAVIVVVGTDLRVRVDPADGTTVVSVAEGAVEVYRRDPETGEPIGEPVRLEAGEVSVVAPGRRPSLPAPADPGTSLLSPATQAPPLGDPPGAPIPPGTIVDEICSSRSASGALLPLPFCRVPDEEPDPDFDGQR